MWNVRPDIVHEILAYLVEHPDAQDTLEGIAQWWLLERYIQQGLAEVQAALSELTTIDLVREIKGPKATVRYQLNSNKLSEIRDILTAKRHRHSPLSIDTERLSEGRHE